MSQAAIEQEHGNKWSQQSPLIPVLNVGTSWANQIVSMAGSFIVTPALIFGLGDSLYGTWLLINTFISYLRTLDLGMSAGTLKFSAGAMARGDRTRLTQIFSSSVVMFAGASVLALAGTVVLIFALPRAFPQSLAGQQTVIFFLGVAGTLDLLFHPQHSSVRSRSLYFIPDTIELFTYSIFKLGLVLYLSTKGLSLWMLCMLTVGETVVRNVAITAAGLWLCDWTRTPSIKAVDRATVRALAVYGGGTLLINIGEIIRFQIDTAIIGHFLRTELITVYSIGMRLVFIAYQMIGVIGAVLIPRFSGLHEQADAAGYRQLLRRANFVTVLVTGYVLANIAVLGQPFLHMWIRKPWVDDAFLVTLIMLPGYFVGLLTGPAAGLLMGAGKLRGLTILTLTEAAANAILSVLLLNRFGIYGVALGTAIPMVIFRGIVFPYVVRISVGVSELDYYRSFGKGILLALLYGALILPVRWLHLGNPVTFVAAGLTTTVLFAVLALIVLPEQREKLLARLRRRSGSD